MKSKFLIAHEPGARLYSLYKKLDEHGPQNESYWELIATKSKENGIWKWVDHDPITCPYKTLKSILSNYDIKELTNDEALIEVL